MAIVKMYTKDYCPYCDRAKELLSQYDVAVEEFDVQNDASRLEEMMQLSKRRTVPQIFIDDLHVGGYDDLVSMQQSGKLTKILAE